jgi:hypothetical protein
MLRKIAVAAPLMTLLSAGAVAQDAGTILANASKAMGADNLKSVTYSGSASAGNFGQSKTIAGPLAVTTITNYTRAIDLTVPASRATGATMPPAIPGAPPRSLEPSLRTSRPPAPHGRSSWRSGSPRGVS